MWVSELFFRDNIDAVCVFVCVAGAEAGLREIELVGK